MLVFVCLSYKGIFLIKVVWWHVDRIRWVTQDLQNQLVLAVRWTLGVVINWHQLDLSLSLPSRDISSASDLGLWLGALHVSCFDNLYLPCPAEFRTRTDPSSVIIWQSNQSLCDTTHESFKSRALRVSQLPHQLLLRHFCVSSGTTRHACLLSFNC